MTNEKALECIKAIKSEYTGEHRKTDINDVVSIDIDSADIEALDMAIEALKERTGDTRRKARKYDKSRRNPKRNRMD